MINSFRYGSTAYSSTKSLLFDGVNEYGTAGAVSDYSYVQNTGIFTIALWVKLTDYTQNRTQVFMGNNGAGSSFKGFWCGYAGNTSDKLRFQCSRGSLVISSLTTANAIADNDWHLIGITGDATNVFFYIDNVKQTGSSTFGTLSTGDSTYVLGFGRAENASNFYYDGYMDDALISDVQWDDSEMTELWNSGCPMDLNNHSRFGDVTSHWRFGDEATDSNILINDIVGGKDITLVNMESGDLTTDIPC